MAERSGQWSGVDPDGCTWKVEVEQDTFDFDQGPVVSVLIDNIEDGLRPLHERRESGLAALMPEQAREIANYMLKVADQVEESRKRVMGDA